MRFCKPRLALAMVLSSKIPPRAIMKATSPAAKISPMAILAIMAMEISSDALIFLSLTILTRAAYISGKPDIKITPHAGSMGNHIYSKSIKKLSTSKKALTIVMRTLAKCSKNSPNLSKPPNVPEGAQQLFNSPPCSPPAGFVLAQAQVLLLVISCSGSLLAQAQADLLLVISCNGSLLAQAQVPVSLVLSPEPEEQQLFISLLIIPPVVRNKYTP